ncbi:hypothetical protein SLEP1_g51784 [Rubroshorea leprosula]|uniref:Uncharacterized protein n=1 Tax=Rubroshorea leprosula TaxID=152421 RepID=A0AAV5M7Z6_9ROSI|nr:hypothetical protein SLEP1_g51784 [Rubroshorea leprosula]
MSLCTPASLTIIPPLHRACAPLLCAPLPAIMPSAHHALSPCTEPMSLLLHRACPPALCAPIPRLCTPAHYSHAPASPTEKNSNTRQNWHY